MSDHESYYGVLQVDEAAEQEVIESAYHRLARKYHPDVNAGPEAHARMAAINRAYATLRHPGRRAIYDRELRRARANGAPAGRWAPSDLRDPPASASEPGLGSYQRATELLAERAAASLRRWSTQWADGLESTLSGDLAAPSRLAEAGQACIIELSDCLTCWERLNPPAAARRLAELGAACLKLEVALVRGTVTFVERADYSVLRPLAGLAERIGMLTSTISAEARCLTEQDLIRGGAARPGRTGLRSEAGVGGYRSRLA